MRINFNLDHAFPAWFWIDVIHHDISEDQQITILRQISFIVLPPVPLFLDRFAYFIVILYYDEIGSDFATAPTICLNCQSFVTIHIFSINTHAWDLTPVQVKISFFGKWHFRHFSEIDSYFSKSWILFFTAYTFIANTLSSKNCMLMNQNYNFHPARKRRR